MLRSVRMPAVALSLLFAAPAFSETLLDPMVRYTTDFDGYRHELRVTTDTTRLETPEGIFRVTTRLVLQYQCHERGIGHPGEPLQVHAWISRGFADPRAAVSIESATNFANDFLEREPPPFVDTKGFARVTDTATGGYAEGPVVVQRAGQRFSRDSLYEMELASSLVSPGRMLRAAHAGSSLEITVRASDLNVRASVSLTPEEAAPLATLEERCPQ